MLTRQLSPSYSHPQLPTTDGGGGGSSSSNNNNNKLEYYLLILPLSVKFRD